MLMEPKVEWIEEYARSYIAGYEAKEVHAADEIRVYFLCVFLVRGLDQLRKARSYVEQVGAGVAAHPNGEGGERIVVDDVLEDLRNILGMEY